LATWKVAPGEATELYRRRWEIETMFAALKSRGFDLEATNRTDPRRVERLIGLLALAFSAS
jgi:IS4 transposase